MSRMITSNVTILLRAKRSPFFARDPLTLLWTEDNVFFPPHGEKSFDLRSQGRCRHGVLFALTAVWQRGKQKKAQVVCAHNEVEYRRV